MTAVDVLRLDRLAAINAAPGDRAKLETRYGQVWDPQELRRDFDVQGYLAPIVVERTARPPADLRAGRVPGEQGPVRQAVETLYRTHRSLTKKTMKLRLQRDVKSIFFTSLLQANLG